METRASYVAVGGFVLLLAAGLVGFVIWLGKFQGREDIAYYDVLFEGAVTYLQVGSPVRYRGIVVGRVTALAIDQEDIDRVRVTIQVDTATPIRSNTVASIELQGITGVGYVQLTTEQPAGKPLPERTEPPYPVIASAPSALEELFQGAPDLVAALNRLVERIAQFLDDENREAVSETLDNLRVLTGTLARETGGVGELLTSGAVAADEIAAMAVEFRALGADVRAQVDTIGGDAQTTVAELREMADTFTEVAGEIDGLLKATREPIQDFTVAGLYEFTQLLTEIRLLVASLQRVSEEIERDPARFFFGDRGRGFKAE